MTSPGATAIATAGGHRDRATATRRRLELSRFLAAAVLYVVAAIAFTWPLALHLGDQLLGYVGFENTGQTLWLYAEWKAYVAAAFQRTVSAHPFSPACWGEFAWTVSSFAAKVSMANGLDFAFTWPLDALFGFPAYYNVKCILILATNGLGTYLLVRGMGGQWWAAWVAGAVFAFNPFSGYQLAIGRVIETILLPLPLYALCLWKSWYQREGWLWPVGAGAALGAATLVYWFNGHFLIVYTIFFVVYQAVVNPPQMVLRALGRLLVVPLVALAVVLPAAMPYCVLMERGERLPGEVREDPGSSHQRNERYLRQLLQWSCDRDYGLRPPRIDERQPQPQFNPPWALPTINAFDGVLTVCGFVAAVLVPVGFRFWSVAVVFLYLLPLGPYLKSGGQPVTVFDHYVPLPYLWMVDHLPLFDRLFFPTQSIGLWSMALGAVVGLALTRIARWRVGAAVALGLCMLAGCAANMSARGQLPLPMTPVVVPQAYRSGNGGFIYLPVNLKYWDGDASFNREFYVEPDLKHVDYHMAMHERKSLWGRNQYLAGKDFWMFAPETATANSFLRFLIYADRQDGVYAAADLQQMRAAGLRYAVVSERLSSHTPHHGDYQTDVKRGAAIYDAVCQRLRQRFGAPLEEIVETTWEKFQSDVIEIRPQQYRLAVFDLERAPAPSAVPSPAPSTAPASPAPSTAPASPAPSAAPASPAAQQPAPNSSGPASGR